MAPPNSGAFACYRSNLQAFPANTNHRPAILARKVISPFCPLVAFPIDPPAVTGVTAPSGIGVDVTFYQTYSQFQGDV
jgi:hypothetical protein